MRRLGKPWPPLFWGGLRGWHVAFGIWLRTCKSGARDVILLQCRVWVMGEFCRGVFGVGLRALAGVGFLVAAHHGAAAAVLTRVHFEAPPGEIIISQHLRTLYYMLPNDQAIAYRVAVPKPGKEWRGVAHIDAKYIRPAWSPPASVLRDIPNLPPVIAGGSPHNPMGVRALSLDRSEIAIHGTNRPTSIGRAVSYGCIRMLNSDVRDLYQRVGVGTTVIMVP